MLRYVSASVLTGLLFLIMDAVINGNPYAVSLMECYKPIAKPGINILAGIIIDLFYGFIISGIFVIVVPVFSTKSRVVKGMAFGSMIWFFRVAMSVISSWMMFSIPLNTLLYTALAGLVEMLLLGVVNGLIIKK